MCHDNHIRLNTTLVSLTNLLTCPILLLIFEATSIPILTPAHLYIYHVFDSPGHHIFIAKCDHLSAGQDF